MVILFISYPSLAFIFILSLLESSPYFTISSPSIVPPSPSTFVVILNFIFYYQNFNF